MTITHRHAYKEIRLQQLRSLCATAQFGSLVAAAKSLGISQPAVWEQVRSLEREFGAVFVEAIGRGSRLTEAGKTLVELAEPVVAAADSMKRTFQERQGQVIPRLTVVATQRILIEDLREVVPHFIAKHPRIRLRFLERPFGQMNEAIETGEADLGVASDQEPTSPRLQTEPAYELDSILVMPHDHPLAKKAAVHPRDLIKYPLVNAADSFTRKKEGGQEDRPRFVTLAEAQGAWPLSGVGPVAGECVAGWSGPRWRVAMPCRRGGHRDSRNAARPPVQSRSAVD